MSDLPEQRYASPHILGWVRSLEGVNARHKAVLYALATFCDDADEEHPTHPKLYASCWPSQDVLARCSGLSVRSVRRVLDELEEMDLLLVEPHKGGSQYLRADRRPNLYVLLCPPPRPDTGNRADAHDRSSDVLRPDIPGTTTGHDWLDDRTPVTGEEGIEVIPEGLLKKPADDDLVDGVRRTYTRDVAEQSLRMMRAQFGDRKAALRAS